MSSRRALTLAVPRGRIFQELVPLLEYAGIESKLTLAEQYGRCLHFETNHRNLDLVQVRSFDVATFVALDGAQLGIVGNDVLMEFDYPNVETLVDLRIGRCRVSVAQPRDFLSSDQIHLEGSGSMIQRRIATKYPRLTQSYFARRGIEVECIKLSGAAELAPKLNISQRIVDIVATGATLAANGLVEVECITGVTSRLIVNRPALDSRWAELSYWVEKFREAVDVMPIAKHSSEIAGPSDGVPVVGDPHAARMG